MPRPVPLSDAEILAICTRTSVLSRALGVTGRASRFATRVTLASQLERRRLERGATEGTWLDAPHTVRGGPDLDSIVLPPHGDLREEEVHFALPGTVEIVTCTGCFGVKHASCRHCNDSGKQSCAECRGLGTVRSGSDGYRRDCRRCQSGRVPCGVCKGRSARRCTRCRTSGQLRRYDRVVVTRSAKHAERIAMESGIPEVGLTGKAGTTRALDVHRARDETPEVATAATALLAAVRVAPEERCVFQRLRVEMIPIERVTYRLGWMKGTAWIMGAERALYAPELDAHLRSLRRGLAVCAVLIVVAALALARGLLA